MKKDKTCSLYVLYYVGAFLLVELAVMALGREEGYFDNYFYLTIEMLTLAVIFLSSRKRKIKIAEQIRLRKITFPRGGLSVLTGVAMGIMTASALYLLNIPGLQFNYDYPLWLLLLFTVENSIFKEIFYRGYIFNELNQKVTWMQAVLLQALIYSLLFIGPNPFAWFLSFTGVILFTLIYLWSGSLWGSVLTQIANTMTIFFLQTTNLNILQKNSAIFLLCAGVVLTAAGMFLLWRGKQETHRNKNKWAVSAPGVLAASVIGVLYAVFYLVVRSGGQKFIIEEILLPLRRPAIVALVLGMAVVLGHLKTGKKLKNILDIAHTILVCLSVLMTVMSLIGIFHTQFLIRSKAYAGFIEKNDTLLVLVFCALTVYFLALIYLSFWGSLKKEWNFVKLEQGSLVKIVLIGVLITFFNLCFTSIPFIRKTLPSFEFYMDAFTNSMESLVLQVVCVLGIPFLEEILFRGIIYRKVRSKYHIVGAVLVSSLCYSFFQGDMVIAVYSVLGSVVYCLCYEIGCSIWGSILVQEVNCILMLIIRRNHLTDKMSGLPVVLLILLSAASFILVSFLLLKYTKKHIKTESIT